MTNSEMCIEYDLDDTLCGVLFLGIGIIFAMSLDGCVLYICACYPVLYCCHYYFYYVWYSAILHLQLVQLHNFWNAPSSFTTSIRATQINQMAKDTILISQIRNLKYNKIFEEINGVYDLESSVDCLDNLWSWLSILTFYFINFISLMFVFYSEFVFLCSI